MRCCDAWCATVCLRSIIAPHHPGDTVSITWVDSAGKTHKASVTFGTGPVA